MCAAYNTSMRVETVTFNGRVYRRYPESKHRHLRVYFQSNWKNKTTPLLLHREVWKAAHGEIPPGGEIHHKDRNPLNNALENLECLTFKEHRRRHIEEGSYAVTDAQREHLDRVRHLATAWTKTEEGRAFHSEKAKRIWQERRERAPRIDTCEQCGGPTETRAMQPTRFCSVRCCQKWHRDHKTYHVDRVCAQCGKTFSVYKSRKNKCCSASCSAKYNRANQGNT